MVSDCWHWSQWLHQPEGAKAGPAQLQQLSIQWWNLPDDDQSVSLTQLKYCSLLIRHFSCWRWLHLSILLVNGDDLVSHAMIYSRYWNPDTEKSLRDCIFCRYVRQDQNWPRWHSRLLSSLGVFAAVPGNIPPVWPWPLRIHQQQWAASRLVRQRTKKNLALHVHIFSGMKYQTVQVLQTQ